MQVSDDLYLGTAETLIAGPDSVGNPGGRGVGPMGRTYIYDIVPLTLQAAGLASSQNPGSGGSFTLTAGTGVTTGFDALGNPIFILDVPRAVSITAAGANTAQYTVTGYDWLGQRQTQDLAAPSTSTVTTLKAFKSILSVTNRNATAGTNGLTVGYRDVFGLPFRVTDAGYLGRVGWDNTVADNAATFVAAVTTDPNTAALGDVRGTIAPSSAANGTRRLVVEILLPAIAVGPNATRVGAVGVTPA